MRNHSSLLATISLSMITSEIDNKCWIRANVTSTTYRGTAHTSWNAITLNQSSRLVSVLGHANYGVSDVHRTVTDWHWNWLRLAQQLIENQCSASENVCGTMLWWILLRLSKTESVRNVTSLENAWTSNVAISPSAGLQQKTRVTSSRFLLPCIKS